MRIIEKIPDPVEYVTCRGCQSVIEYNKSDVKHDKHELWSRYINCPNCDINTVVINIFDTMVARYKLANMTFAVNELNEKDKSNEHK